MSILKQDTYYDSLPLQESIEFRLRKDRWMWLWWMHVDMLVRR